MVIGKPTDLLRFAFEVLPSLAKGSLQISNQSLVAWLARIFLPETNLVDFSIGLGGFQMLALPLAFILMLLVWSRLRNRALTSLELGLLIILALLMGPITWGHYTSWVVIVVVYMADYELWTRWQNKEGVELFAILAMGLIVVNIPIIYYVPSSIASQWGYRLATGTQTLGLIILLGVGTALLWQPAAQLCRPAASQDCVRGRPIH